MAKQPKPKFNEKDLTKGQVRKLVALRKSLGDEIADKAFAEWLEKLAAEKTKQVDENAEAIADAIAKLINERDIRFPRGGYHITRWRDQISVKPAASKK